MRRYLGARLHRRLFVLLGASIVMTAVVVGALQLVTAGHGVHTWSRTLRQTEQLVGEQFADVWDEPARRDHLASRLHEVLGMPIVLRDAGGAVIGQYGPACDRPDFRADVVRGGRTLGQVAACGGRRGNGTFVVAVFVLGVMLWGSAGMIARRLVRPLGEVAGVANAIGAGKLDSRVRTGRRHVGEVAVLAEAINNMADRIEQQMADQRELLAGVSHEIRSPLARMRVLLELARANRDDAKALDEIEREVLEIDDLVGELLASSRLDFTAVDKRPLDAAELAARALERAGLPGALLSAPRERRIFRRPDAARARAGEPARQRRAPRWRRDAPRRRAGASARSASSSRTRDRASPRATCRASSSRSCAASAAARRRSASGCRWCGASPKRTGAAPSPRTVAAGGARVGFSVAATPRPPG